MSEVENKRPDFMLLYDRYQKLKPGPQAELKRVVQVDDLIEIPAFYRLIQGDKVNENMQRLIYCLPLIKHQDGGDSLGKALAKAEINEKRLFMVVRSQKPNDLIQLRRLLKQIEPKVDWLSAANTLYFWNDKSKRQLLEDFFFNQKNKT